MVDLDELIQKGEELLEKSLSISLTGNAIQGKLVAEFKAFHIQGRFALRKIDKKTLTEYDELFRSNVDSSTRDNYISYNNYLQNNLENCLGILMAVRASGIEEALDRSLVNIFISHGIFSPSFRKLEAFVRALGMIPIYDDTEPTGAATINEHVHSLFSESDFYVILAKKETTRGDGMALPNHNVIIEFDRLVQLGKENLIVLLEDGCKMPSMQQDIIYVGFPEDCMDTAFTKLCSELVRHDLLK